MPEPLTHEQIRAGQEVRRKLHRAEREHPNCHHLHALHDSLSGLLETFKDRLSGDQYVALGGGTPKTPPPDEE